MSARVVPVLMRTLGNVLRIRESGFRDLFKNRSSPHNEQAAFCDDLKKKILSTSEILLSPSRQQV